MRGTSDLWLKHIHQLMRVHIVILPAHLFKIFHGHLLHLFLAHTPTESIFFSFRILFFFVRHRAFLWKKFVLRSPSLSHEILERCNHIISSLYSNLSSFRRVSQIKSLFYNTLPSSSYSSCCCNPCNCFLMFPNCSWLHAFRSFITTFSGSATAPRSLPGFLLSQDFSISIDKESTRSHIIL